MGWGGRMFFGEVTTTTSQCLCQVIGKVKGRTIKKNMFRKSGTVTRWAQMPIVSRGPNKPTYRGETTPVTYLFSAICRDSGCLFFSGGLPSLKLT